MPDIRALLDWHGPYHAINREERNVAALLYHALLLPGNLARFLSAIDCPFAIRDDDMALYFEYALLRDLWKAKAHGNEASARRVIVEGLKPPPGIGVERMSILEINELFGAVPKPSSTKIQSPGNWSVRRFMHTIRDNDFFLRVCRFKWCFNAKPDLVIQLAPDKVVCIEAKLESGEGSYPSQADEKKEFDRRGLERVGQTALQKQMFEELLGMKAQFVFLVADGAKGVSETHTRVSWSEAFGAVDLVGCPTFMHEWVSRLG